MHMSLLIGTRFFHAHRFPVQRACVCRTVQFLSVDFIYNIWLSTDSYQSGKIMQILSLYVEVAYLVAKKYNL